VTKVGKKFFSKYNLSIKILTIEMENLENQNQEIIAEKKSFNWLLLSILGVVFSLVIFVVAFSFYGWWQVYKPVCPGICSGQAPVAIKIDKGMGVKEISSLLLEQGLIRDKFWFEVYVWAKKQGSRMQAGGYELNIAQNVPEIVNVITGGKVINDEVQITFPEGFALAQIKERLLAQGFLVAENLDQEKIADYQVQYKLLAESPSEASLEGFLFPDTYRFKNDAKEADIVKKLLDNFDKKMLPEWRETIAKQNKTLYEIIILASIVQQEAINDQDMPMVAGVFANRLRIGMALESDATINYVTGKKDRQPLYEDLKVNSPYNTYQNRGLPPTPICNPGAAAIEAAINPVITDYLFFLHPLDGPTVFSKTLDEHNRNKAKWLK